MTARLLEVLGTLRGRLFWRVLLAAIALPLLPLALFYDALMGWARTQRTEEVLSTRTARCPGGPHRIALWGHFECAHCRLPFEGHGFAECPHCGHVAYSLSCGCGAVLVNPLWEPEP